MRSYQSQGFEGACGQLYGTPKPLPGESFTSWMQRVCRHFGMSYARFARFVGVSISADLDLAFSSDRSEELAGMVGLREEDIAVMRLPLRKPDGCRQLRHHLNYICGRARYWFCPVCLRSDPVPYYRLEWRFKVWIACPVHKLPMGFGCGRCRRTLRMTRRVLGGRSLVPTLAHCHDCWFDLRAMQPRGGLYRPIEQVISQEQEFVSGLLKGYFQVAATAAEAPPV